MKESCKKFEVLDAGKKKENQNFQRCWMLEKEEGDESRGNCGRRKLDKI